jgi:hypothetical protein
MLGMLRTHFDSKALCRLAQTCKELKTICYNDYFWKYRYEVDFQQQQQQQQNELSSQINWKTLYENGK